MLTYIKFALIAIAITHYSYPNFNSEYMQYTQSYELRSY